MSKLRKALKKTYSVFVRPSDEAIDWKATAVKLTEDVEYFSILKDLAFPDEELETVKQKFLKNANKMSVYDYYTYKKFDSDVIVSKSDVPVLRYVFEDFNLTDLDIVFSQVEGLKTLFSAIKQHDISSANAMELLVSILEKKELKEKLLELVRVILDAKLVKCIGVDEGISKEDIIKETMSDLTVQDIKMLVKFIQASLKLDVEKKNTLES